MRCAVRAVTEKAREPVTPWAEVQRLLARCPGLDSVCLVDTANGIGVREPPGAWFYPNVDLSIQLHRQPTGDWVGLDATAVFGPDGQGLTDTVLHDRDGPVGRAQQTLTIRPAR